jgi:hypothetical protein
MSGMLQLVVVLPNAQCKQERAAILRLILVMLSVWRVDDKLKHIGHLLSHSCRVEC